MKQILFIFFILFTLSCSAQNISITGRVTTSSGLPLQGAAINVKGENNGTTTNSDGQFHLLLRIKAVVIVSHVGYRTQELRVDSTGKNYVISLQEASLTMKEVTVSTGYQEIAKESTTGSFDKIDNKLYEREQSPDVLSRLEGITSSLYVQKVGGSPGISIRGLSTLTAGTSPLIVLDNFPYEGNISNINPNDVESVTVLKDAAAAAIWGARAGNGVVVITTKKGKYGEKAHVMINTNLSLQPEPDLSKDPSFLDASDFIDVEKFLFSKGKYDADLSNTSSRPIVSPVVEILAKQRAGLLSASDADAKINLLRNLDVRNDYAKYFYREGVRQQYALNLSGGSAAVNYLVSGGYDKNLGNTTGNQNDRSSVYAVTNVRPIHKMELQLGINYTHITALNNSILPIIPTGKSTLYPYGQLADAAGNALPVEFNYRQAYLDTAGAGLLLDWKYRPLDELRLRDNKTIADDILLKLALHYEVLPGLHASVSGQWEKSYSSTANYSSLQSYNARNLVNKFSQLTASGIIHNLPVGGILNHSENTLGAYGARGQLDYAKEWTNDRLSVIAGSEVRETHALAQTATVYGYDNNLLTSSPVNNITSFTLYGSLGSGSIPSANGFGDVLNRFVSFYTNADYTLKKKYTLSGSMRKDASNLFGVKTNQKWTPLWSAGAAWKLSDESFYHLSWLPIIRLRLTYGYSGNVKNDLAAVPTIKYSSPDPPTNLVYAYVNSLPNPELRWEKSGILNAALDFAALQGSVSGSVEYFHKNATRLLSPAPVDPTIGLSQMILNTANLSGDGIDLKLNCKILDRDFKINTLLLFSYVTNKVTRYLISNANKGGYTGTGYSITPIEGKDPYSLISYKWGGLDPLTGDPMGYIGGVLSKDYTKLVSPTSLDDLVFSGPTRPPFFGNMINSFSWKWLTLSANIGYRFGYYFRRSSLNYGGLFNSWTGNMEYTQRWQKPGDEGFTNVPSLVYPSVTNRDKFYNNSEATVEKGDNIRLQDISLNLALPKHIQLYFYASNVTLIWKANASGNDPDYGSGIPASPVFTFGIKAGL